MNDQPSAAASAAAREAIPYPSSAQAWYLVFTLLFFYIFSFIDRQIIALMVEPIKRDLQMTDTQIGLLQGLSFAILYCTLGVPIGRLADRMSRKKIIAAGVVIWSLMATLCGLAKSVTQLFLARIGVGVGEAALSPAAYSMITDAFPTEKLGRAFSVYNMGIPIGSGIALLVGGFVVGAVSTEGATVTLPLVGEVRAWQFVFIVTGAPGLLLPLLLLAVREPTRRGLISLGSARAGEQKIPLMDVVRYMRKHGGFYSLHSIALGLFAMVTYAVGAWLPTVMNRTYGIAPATIGAVMGLSMLSINVLGILIAGRLCDRWTARGIVDAPIRVCFIVAIGIAATGVFTPFMPTATLGLIMLCIAGLPFHGFVAMGPMAINQVTPNQMRAQASSVYLFVVNFLGMAVGPALVPIISDYILRDPQQIRWGLSIVVLVGSLLAAVLLWIERPLYRARMAEIASWR